MMLLLNTDLTRDASTMLVNGSRGIVVGWEAVGHHKAAMVARAPPAARHLLSRWPTEVHAHGCWVCVGARPPGCRGSSGATYSDQVKGSVHGALSMPEWSSTVVVYMVTFTSKLECSA